MIRFKRIWFTVRRLKVRQILYRVWYSLRRPRAIVPPVIVRANFRGTIPHIAGPIRMTGPTRFRFLNETKELERVGWQGTGCSDLWRYHLHYFDDLNAQKAQARRDWHERLIDRWIDENPCPEGVGWDSYPTSLRIVNWIKFDLRTQSLGVRAQQNLATQIACLSRRIEYHIDGNHLLKNAKALVFGGVYFDHSEWLRQGLRVLRAALREQILPSGAHFEHSPMYHAQVTEDVLDLLALGRISPKADALEALCTPLVPRLLEWLEQMTHPDGAPAFFSDTCLNEAPLLADLWSYAKRLGIEPASVEIGANGCSHARLEAQNAVAIVDIAPLGPDTQPGHGHADALSFELSLFSQRVLVNSGVSTYEKGPLRDLQRGTAAHNTVCVSGENQSDLWAAFRVGQRAHILKSTCAKGQASGSHDGYLSRFGVVHKRVCSLDDGEFRIEDWLIGACVSATARFHFHPDVRVQLITPYSGRGALQNGSRFEWTLSESGQTLEQTQWFPEFGKAQSNQCLVVPMGGYCCAEFRWGI